MNCFHNFCSKRDITGKLTELVQISDTKVKVGFSGTTEEQPFGSYVLKAHTWYFLTFTWLAENGSLEVRRNGIRVAKIDSYAKGQNLPE